MSDEKIIERLADVVDDPHESPHPVLHLPPRVKAHPERCSPNCGQHSGGGGHCAYAVPRCMTLHARRKLARKIDAAMDEQGKNRLRELREAAARRPESIDEAVVDAAEREYERRLGFDKR